MELTADELEATRTTWADRVADPRAAADPPHGVTLGPGLPARSQPTPALVSLSLHP